MCLKFILWNKLIFENVNLLNVTYILWSKYTSIVLRAQMNDKKLIYITDLGKYRLFIIYNLIEIDYNVTVVLFKIRLIKYSWKKKIN